MKVALDIVGARHSGTAMIARETIESAINNNRITSLVVYATPAHERRVSFPAHQKIRMIEKPFASQSSAMRFAWQLGGSHRAARRDKANVFLGLSNGGVAFGEPRTAIYVQQALPFSPDAMRLMPRSVQARMLAIREVIRMSLRTASRIVVQTNAMQSMLQRAFGIPDYKFICVTPASAVLDPPAFDTPALRSLLALPQGARFAYVGSDEPYKNFAAQLRAFTMVRAKHPDARLITTLPPEHPAASEHVLCLGALSRGELHALYQEVNTVVMPSLVESLSLPLVEAMQVGRPIIAADRPYAHDVCDDAAVYVDPNNASAMAEGMIQLIEDGALARSLAERGRAVREKRTMSRPFERMWNAVLDLA